MDFGPFFNGHFKPKIVKIGLVISSGGAAQNMKIFFKEIWVKLDALYLKILNFSNRLPFICKNKKKMKKNELLST